VLYHNVKKLRSSKLVIPSTIAPSHPEPTELQYRHCSVHLESLTLPAMITLIGATGFTGTLIAHELNRIGSCARLAARDKTKLNRLASDLDVRFDTMVVDVTDASTVSRAFDGASVVINCAGPFTGLGEPVVREAARRGVHYLDTTGEQAFIRYVFEELHDEASRNGAALVPSCAFEYALGDAAAELSAEDLQPCDEVEIAYSIKGFGTSRGTRKSIIKASGAQGYQYRNSALAPLPSSAISRAVTFPKIGRRTATSLPFGEAIMVPRHVKTQNVTTLMVLPVPAAILAAASFVAPVILRSPLAGLMLRGIDRGSFGPSIEERQKSEFEILCTARRGHQLRRVTVAGRDPYGITATIAAHIASLLQRGSVENIGAITPSMVAGPKAVIESTSAAGVSWTVGEISAF
jgi:short subunit dehydrogenase-like uncharacterized protein